MRLIVSDTSRAAWAYLEPSTVGEIGALGRSITQGDWTIGRGDGAITRLRTLAARLGYPAIEVYEPRSRRLIIVQRDAEALAGQLRGLTPATVSVIIDRRVRERRRRFSESLSYERRRKDRREAVTAMWSGLPFLVATMRSEPPPS